MGLFQTNTKETSRIEAFSDGVFAIAITLLVLDIHVPEIKGDQSLLTALLKQWTNYLAFLVGFFTILICWINHHVMFEYIHKANSTLLMLNGLKLLVISFTPFVTAVLSKYIGTPQQSTAVTIYGFNFALMGIAMFLICAYSCMQQFVKEPLKRRKAFKKLYAFAAILSITIFLVSFVSTPFALVLFFAMFFIFMSPKRVVSFLEKRQREHNLSTSLIETLEPEQAGA
jgi:uncharacterized membrane protein